MTVLPLLTFPDPGLKRFCAPVTEFDTALANLAADLRDTMRAAPGIGITAAHVGVFQRITVIELDPADIVRVYVNPQVVSASIQTISHMEGSVSMPGITDEVIRPKAIRLRYDDLSGVAREEDCDGLLAICVQHEIDQLDGIFWLQRLSRLKRDRLIRKWEKQNR